MQDDLAKIKQAVFAKRPVLQNIVEKFGTQTLEDYITTSWKIPEFEPDKLFLDTLNLELQKLYGHNLAKQATAQLKIKPSVSTVDHHGIWSHPIFVNSSCIFSLSSKPENLSIVFSTESVSLNNSCWAGSFLYHNNDLNLHRQSFFTDKQKTKAVIAAPGINNADVVRFNNKSQNRFKELVDKLEIKQQGNFSTQACHISQKLWELVFPSAPKLIYVPLESLISSYLVKAFGDDNHILSKIILTAKGRAKWQEYFGTEHTFMFWGLDEKGRRVVLKEMPDDASEIVKLIENKKIYPSGPLCFVVLLYAGFACAGGFNQTTWLINIKENFIKILQSLSSEESIIDRISEIPTQNFSESSLARLKMGERYVQPSAIDLYLTKKDYYPAYKKLAQTLTLEQSLNLALPEIYNIVVPKAERYKEINLSNLEIWIYQSL